MTGGSVQEMYMKLNPIYSFKNCIDDSSTKCFKKLFNLSFKNHCIDSRSLLYGIQCSFESMLVLMVLLLCICKGTHDLLYFVLYHYCVASRQLVLLAGEEQERETSLVLMMSIY